MDAALCPEVAVKIGLRGGVPGMSRRFPLRRAVTVRLHHPPEASVRRNVVAFHLARPLVGVVIEGMPTVGDLRRAVPAFRGAKEIDVSGAGRL
jgi:hypothetical protein